MTLRTLIVVTMFGITFVALISITLLILLWRWSTFWNRQGLSGLSLLEWSGRFKMPINEHGLKMAKKYGKIFHSFGFPRKSIVINDPAIIHKIYSTKFKSFPDRFDWNFGPSSVITKMLLFVPGDPNWKRIHSIVSPAFSSAKLKAMTSQMTVICDNLIKSLNKFAKTGQVIDISLYLGAFTIDSLSICAFGIATDCLNNADHPALINVKKFFNSNISFDRIISIIAPSMARFFKIHYFDPTAYKYFDNLIQQIITERKLLDNDLKRNIKEKRTDLLQILIDSSNDGQGSKQTSSNCISTDEMIAQGVMLYLAGYDTTFTTLCHLIYYLSTNKECQQRLYEELENVGNFSYENLTQLKYLSAVIDETLRLAPPLLTLTRICAEDTKISGLNIPAGTLIETLPYVLHRDPDLWSDPLKFDPDRFLEPVHNTWAYIPFGGGPRVCLGQRFALNEMRICCARLFYKFEFCLEPGFKLEYYNGNLVLTPKSIMVNIKARY